MSVSKSIIATTTLSRREVKTVVTAVSSTIPPETRLTTVDGALVAIPQSPEREGQLLAYVIPGEKQITTMYVVVTIDGVLVWAPVVPVVTPIAPRSGKPFDPLYNFYGLHA